MNEPQYVAQTLAWCNARRKERGKRPLKKLPKGERTAPKSCPCGAATGLLVGCSRYDEPGKAPAFEDEWRFALPRPVQRFVMAFDDGRLPQYEANNS